MLHHSFAVLGLQDESRPKRVSLVQLKASLHSLPGRFPPKRDFL